MHVLSSGALFNRRAIAMAAILFALAGSSALAQSFSLDDNQTAPYYGPLGFGYGAENPWGMGGGIYPPGLAPSPTRAYPLANWGTSHINSPSPAPGIVGWEIQYPGVINNGLQDGYLASLSSNKRGIGPNPYSVLPLMFSVDRSSVGAPGTRVESEAALSQAHGDIYTTFASISHPGLFAGTLTSLGLPGLPSYAGLLPVITIGSYGNALTWNQGLPAPAVSGLGLMTGTPYGPATVLPPYVLAPPISTGVHDNVDAWDNAKFESNYAMPTLDINCYFNVYPTTAAAAGVSSADVFLAPAGSTGTSLVPWAPAGTMGLDTTGLHPVAFTPFADAVDALVIWDNGVQGLLEPTIDYALFSLSPGSGSLAAVPAGMINDADVFFTDFTGLFATYAPAPLLGLTPDAAGGFIPRSGAYADGVDALDIAYYAVQGDQDGDFDIDSADIDLFCLRRHNGPPYPPQTDVDANGTVDGNDLDYMIGPILGTQYGDSDLDGDVDGADFDDWRIRDSLGDPIGWATGDWDCDGDVDGADFDIWRLRPVDFYPGGEVLAVPEPATLVLLVLGGPTLVLAHWGNGRRRGKS